MIFYMYNINLYIMNNEQEWKLKILPPQSY